MLYRLLLLLLVWALLLVLLVLLLLAGAAAGRMGLLTLCALEQGCVQLYFALKIV